MKHRPILITVLKGVVFVFLVGPVGGAVVGAIVASVAFAVSGEYVSFGAPFGAIFGGVTGLAHALVFARYLHNDSLIRLTTYMAAGTLAGGLPVALIPEAALFAWCSGMIGCWVGLELFSNRRIERYLDETRQMSEDAERKDREAVNS